MRVRQLGKPSFLRRDGKRVQPRGNYMYQVFDAFLATDTWFTGHKNDEDRFYLALQKVVRNEGFNADQMGEYFRQVKGASPDDDDPYFSDKIDELRAKAWAVSDYINVTGE